MLLTLLVVNVPLAQAQRFDATSQLSTHDQRNLSVRDMTETPVIVCEDVGDGVQVTAIGNGYVCLYLAEVLVAEGEGEATYFVPYGVEGEEYGFSATAQEDGKEISNYALYTVYVPALPLEQTCSPEITIEFQEAPRGCLVTIIPCEPSDIIWRYSCDDGEWTEWMFYDDQVFFSSVGTYMIEAYAIADGKAESEHLTYYFVVPPLQQTEPPVIMCDDTGEGVLVTAIGNGHVCLYLAEVLVAEGEGEATYFVPYGVEGEEYGFSATAQEDGKEISNYALYTVYVPALPLEMTGIPEITIEYQENPHGCLVTIIPCEPSVIYYRYCFEDGEWTEWMTYDDQLFFSSVGTFTIEAYAIADGKAESEHLMYCFVIPPIQQTETPIFIVEETDNGIQVTVEGYGYICLYQDGLLIAEGEGEVSCFLPYGEFDKVYTFEATAQEDGKEISDYAMCTVLVPALPIYETPIPVWNCELTDDAMVITVVGEGTITLYVQFIDNATGGITTETFEGYGDVVVALPRTDETYYVNFWAVAQVDGGNPGVTDVEYFVEIPAKEVVPTLTGDADGDGKVTISDVSAIIDCILSGDTGSVYFDCADIDGDGRITIADVSALIDYLLHKHW